MESEILKQHLQKVGSLPTLRNKTNNEPATEAENATQIDEVIPTESNSYFRKSEEQINGNWDREIKELEQFFRLATLPKGPISLNEHTKIVDPNKFIDSHFKIVKAQNGKPVYRPYFDRLEQLKSLLTLSKN